MKAGVDNLSIIDCIDDFMLCNHHIIMMTIVSGDIRRPGEGKKKDERRIESSEC